jgi:hypothetical protein
MQHPRKQQIYHFFPKKHSKLPPDVWEEQLAAVKVHGPCSEQTDCTHDVKRLNFSGV